MFNYYLKRNVIHRLVLLGLASCSCCVVYGQSNNTTKKTDSTSSENVTLLHKSQPQRTLLQATATVYNNQLVTTPAPSFLQALPGRISGLYTRQRSGVQDTDDPISVIDFKIRGQIPLILIDGVPRDFASIEPESIESITVLKDAPASVMFGQRSSGNIILVTTRRPKETPFQLSFTAQHGLQEMLRHTKPLSSADYAILYNEARNNDGLLPVYSAADIIAYRNGSDPLFHPNNDYSKYFLNPNAVLDRYNVNVQSGTKTARFYTSLDYQNEGGFFNTADLNSYSTNAGVDRYIVRSNVSVDLNPTLNVGLNIFGRIQNSNQPGGTTSTIYNDITFTPSNAYSIFNPDGSLGGNTSFTKNLYGMLNNSGYYKSTSRDLAADVSLNKKLDAWLEGLWAKADVSYNNTVDQSVNRAKGFAVYGLNINSGQPIYSQIGTNGNQSNVLSLSSRRTYTYGKLSLGYDKHFGDNTLNVLLLADNQSTVINLNLPATYTNTAANATYNYQQKYFAEASLSYGGFNRYKPGHRFGWFYAAALGWDMAKEKFLADVSWIDQLKPRISYGLTGNANVGYYVYDQYYNYGNTDAAYYFGATPTVARYYEEQTLANPNATWEKARKLNIGVDASLFAKRLKITAEYFNDTYFDLMQVRGNSISLIGQNYPPENIGRNRYSGFETNVAWNGKVGAATYSIAGNLSMLKSKVLYQDEIYRQYDYQRRTGLPVGQPFGYIAEGFFQSQAEIDVAPKVDGYVPKPGDIRYRDMNDDGIIDQLDETAIGTQKPLIYYGATGSISYKGFDLSIAIQGVANRDAVSTSAYNSVIASLETPFASTNGQAFEQHLNRWTPSNAANATYPRLTIGGNANNQKASTFWVRRADYLRLQNVDLGYTLPKKWVSRLKLNGLRVFVNGFNLYSFDTMRYYDPEGYNSIFPIRRTFNMGVNIKL